MNASRLSDKTFFAQSVHNKLASPQAAQRSLFCRKMSSVAPP